MWATVNKPLLSDAAPFPNNGMGEAPAHRLWYFSTSQAAQASEC